MRTLVIGLCLIVAGCEISPSEVGKNEFDPNKIAYFKDQRTNICYAVVSYGRIDTSGRWAGGLSHSSVPCSAEFERLLRP